ncbi:MAG: hypothetical protein ABFE13_03535 [Phycisphaerales bacterium]
MAEYTGSSSGFAVDYRMHCGGNDLKPIEESVKPAMSRRSAMQLQDAYRSTVG